MSLLKIVIDHTYSPARKRRLPAFCICLALLFGLHAFALDQDMLNSLPVDATAVYDFKIPPKPTGHVLDMAHFLAQEMIQSLDEELTKEAREHDVQVYLLIVPSVQKNALDPFTRQVADAWTKGFFGAIIVFDDATGHVSIQQSDLVTKRFYEFELSVLLKDTMSTSKRPKLSRDALQHTTLNLKDSLYTLKVRANRDDRKSLWARMALGTLGLLAALLVGFEYFRRRQTPDPARRETDLATK